MRNNMKIYRFVYEFGSIRTERFFRAKSKKEATERFRQIIGDKKIYSIEWLGERK